MSGVASSCEEDVLRIKKKLEKMMKANEIDIASSTDMLNTMKKLPIDLQVLKNTGIGVVLNNLRRNCNSEDLGSLAKNLLKNWKKLVANESQQNNGSSPNSNSNDSSSKQPVSPPPSSNNGTATATKLNFSNTVSNNNNNGSNGHNSNGKRTIDAVESSPLPIKTNFSESKPRYNHLKRTISYTETKDPVRLKCREMLAQALELTESIENGAELCDVLELAGRCEDVIFNEFKNVDLKYKNRVRSRVINLKDSKNPKLRENVRLGLITPDKLANMTAEEMANDDLKKLREKFTQEAIDDHQMARTQGAKTTQLTCGKCKKNQVSFSEMQTRSADEPMTTFAYCENCGHRWKFG